MIRSVLSVALDWCKGVLHVKATLQLVVGGGSGGGDAGRVGVFLGMVVVSILIREFKKTAISLILEFQRISQRRT